MHFIKLELDFRNKAWIFYYYYYLFNSVNFQGIAAYHVAFHENYLAGRFHTNKKTDSFFIKRFSCFTETSVDTHKYMVFLLHFLVQHFASITFKIDAYFFVGSTLQCHPLSLRGCMLEICCLLWILNEWPVLLTRLFTSFYAALTFKCSWNHMSEEITF